MEIRLSPDQEAYLAAMAAITGRSTDELVREAVTLWEERQAEQPRNEYLESKHSPAGATARIRELRKGNFLPEGETIEDLINHGRA
jgi:predicted transcriptional regulator